MLGRLGGGVFVGALLILAYGCDSGQPVAPLHSAPAAPPVAAAPQQPAAQPQLSMASQHSGPKALVISGPTQAPAAPAISASLGWKPDPDCVEQLEEYQDVGKYQVRVPLWWSNIESLVEQHPNERHISWIGSSHADGARPQFSVILHPLSPAEAAGMTVEQCLTASMPNLTSQFTAVQQGTMESGRIGNMNFVKTTCVGTFKDDSKFKAKFLLYATKDSENFILLAYVCEESHYEEAAPLVTAAMLSFRKK